DKTRLQRVGGIIVRLERSHGRRQRAWRTAEVAHGQRYLGLGDDATSPRQRFVGTKAPAGTLKKLAGTQILAELGHCDTAQSQCRRVVAEGNALESVKRVAGCEGTRGSSDQRVHVDRILLLCLRTNAVGLTKARR